MKSNANTAQAMFDALSSVGVERCDVTFTALDGTKVGFRPKQPIPSLRRAVFPILQDTADRQQNFIVRPCPHPRAVLIQLDDLDTRHVERVKPAAFMTLQTSPGNYQAWVAVEKEGLPDDFARRLRKGAGADPSASGATRVAGSINFKSKYAPAFPTVELAHVSPGKIVTAAELDAMGIVASPEPPRQAVPGRVSSRQRGRRKWPDYQRCVEGAPPNHDKSGPDVSKADFVWCMTAIDWGWSVEETAARLMELSAKAHENAGRYAMVTAQNAALAVERTQGRKR